MAYRTLLIGKNTPIIDTFFNFLWESYELYTSSTRFEDLKRHIEILDPDIIIYCLYNEYKEEMSTVNKVRIRTAGQKAEFIVIGTEEDINAFTEQTDRVPDLILKKPLTTEMIHKQITNHMEDKKRAEERAERIRAAEEETNRRKHILAIDDDPMMLKLIKEHLHHKYDVSIAKGGLMAYKFLESHDTDLILLDYEMPIEDGPTVFKNIRQMEGKDDIPIVFLTGLSAKDKIVEVLKLKPQGYLLKPIDRGSLLDKIDSLIG